MPSLSNDRDRPPINSDLLALNDPTLPFPYVLPEPDLPPQRGGTFRYAWHQDVATLDPTQSTSASTLLIANSAGERLLSFVGNGRINPFALEVEPGLARSWEVTPDGRTYTFHLAGGVRFHNKPPVYGRAFVASDVRAVYERYAAGGVSSAYFENVAAIETPDDVTLRIRLHRPQPDFIYPLASRDLVLYPIELVESFGHSRDFIGTGPMVLVEAEAGVGARFVRNDDYWAGDVPLDGMEFTVMHDAATRLGAFEAGAVDYADFFVTNAEEALAFHDRFPEVQIHLTPVFSALYSLALNLELEQFADVRVRRALSLAIDREAMASELYQGLAKTLPTIPWTYLFDNEPDTAALGSWFRYDSGEARRLLAAAGRTGLSFEMLYYNYDDTQNRRANEMIVADLARIGVDVRLRHVEVGEFNELWNHGRVPEAADGWAAIGYAADTYFKDHVRTGSSSNRWHISDPEVDTWATAQSSELDPLRRRELQRYIWDRMLDQVYRVEKIANMKIYAYQEWLRNFRSGGALNSIGRGDHGAYIAGVWIDPARAGRRQPESREV